MKAKPVVLNLNLNTVRIIKGKMTMTAHAVSNIFKLKARTYYCTKNSLKEKRKATYYPIK